MASLVTSHSLTLSGLTPNTTYYYRVSSTDASNNTAKSPVSPADHDLHDSNRASGRYHGCDFTAGTSAPHAIPATANGELILPPTMGTEFNRSPVFRLVTGVQLPLDRRHGKCIRWGT